ncbi:hypothetical protein NVS83_05920 [Ancylobacter sp. GSK1Z-4-2]|nr:hypothetical protein [Ancylobacter mangrovi]MCS0501932.1 hypothetical protein [Ancylobacter mangrovi]
MTQRNKPRDAAVFGIDIGKNTFHVVGMDGTGAPIQRATFRWETLLQFFERAARTVVGMEACPGSQWLAHSSFPSLTNRRRYRVCWDLGRLKSQTTIRRSRPAVTAGL